MKKTLADAGSCLEKHTMVCTDEVGSQPETGKITLKFSEGSKSFTLTLEAGLYALLDDIACKERLPLADIVRMIRRRRNPRHSLPEAACNFIGHYYFLKAHAPMQNALPVVFQAPPLRIRNRPHPLNRPVYEAWRRLTGVEFIQYPDGGD